MRDVVTPRFGRISAVKLVRFGSRKAGRNMMCLFCKNWVLIPSWIEFRVHIDQKQL